MLWIARLFSRLPLGLMHAMGALLGRVVYALSPRYRRMLRTNLASAGFDEPAIRRAAVAEAGRAIFELPAIWLRADAAINRLVREVSGQDVLDAARAGGRGFIIVAPHMGAFELIARWLGMQAPFTALYRPPKLAWLEPIMLAGRAQGMVKLATTDVSGVRKLLKALRAREAIGLLPDQVPGKGDGAWIEFFGRPAYTMTLLSRLHESSGAPMVLAYAERLAGGAGYHMHFRVMPERRSGETSTRHLNRGIEDLIRSRPAQYLWSYNRFKVPAGAEPPGAATPAAR